MGSASSDDWARLVDFGTTYQLAPRELAEIAWLAARMGASQPRESQPSIPNPSQLTTPKVPEVGVPMQLHPPEDRRDPQHGAGDGSTDDVAPASSPGHPVDGRLVRPPPVSRSLDWARALNRLARHAEVGPLRVDVAASVRSTARQDALQLAFRRDRRPTTWLAVVEDRAGQLAPWWEAVSAIVELARVSGRFRRVVHLQIDLGDDVEPLATELARLGAPGEPVLMLLVTDGLGERLVDGGLAEVLVHGFAVPARVAWTHPWGRQCWRDIDVLDWALRGKPRTWRSGAGGAPVAVVDFSAEGLLTLEAFAAGRTAQGLRGVWLPEPVGVPEAVCGAPDFVPDLDPASRQLLALAAGVPGRVDLDLLWAFCGFGEPAGLTTVAVGRVAVAQALASGLLRQVDADDGLLVEFVGDDTADTRGRTEALRWLDRPRAAALVGFLVKYLRGTGAADRLGVPYALLLALRGEEADELGPIHLSRGALRALEVVIALADLRVPEVVRRVLARLRSVDTAGRVTGRPQQPVRYVGLGLAGVEALGALSDDLPGDRIGIDREPSVLNRIQPPWSVVLDVGSETAQLNTGVARYAGEIESLLEGAERVVLMIWLGGRTGPATATQVARMARKQADRLVTMVTAPPGWGLPDDQRLLERLREISDVLVAVSAVGEEGFESWHPGFAHHGQLLGVGVWCLDVAAGAIEEGWPGLVRKWESVGMVEAALWADQGKSGSGEQLAARVGPEGGCHAVGWGQGGLTDWLRPFRSVTVDMVLHSRSGAPGVHLTPGIGLLQPRAQVSLAPWAGVEMSRPTVVWLHDGQQGEDVPGREVRHRLTAAGVRVVLEAVPEPIVSLASRRRALQKANHVVLGWTPRMAAVLESHDGRVPLWLREDGRMWASQRQRVTLVTGEREVGVPRHLRYRPVVEVTDQRLVGHLSGPGVPEPGMVVHRCELDLEEGGRPLELLYVPAGAFGMGSPAGDEGRDRNEAPQHMVTLTRPLAVATTPVTQAAFLSVMGKNPSRFPGPNRPVEKVSWIDAVLFCNALSTLEGRPLAYWVPPDARFGEGNVNQQEIWSNAIEVDLAVSGYRLPTEAEWEHFCRAGTTSQYWSGDTQADLAEVGWFNGNSGRETHMVGEKLPNPWGLLDVHGNVWEWCHDFWKRAYADDVTNPVGPPHGLGRVVRGGSWNNASHRCRAAFRDAWHPGWRSSYHGLRVVLSLVHPREP